MIRVGIHGKSMRLLGEQIQRDVRVFGREIRSKLREAGNEVRRKQRELLKSGYGPSLRRIKRTSKTGRVRATSRILSQHRVVIRLAKRQPGGSIERDWEAFVGPTPGGPAFYAKFHELGVRPRRTAAGENRGALPARPWMRPAIDATANRVEQILADSYKAFRIVK